LYRNYGYAKIFCLNLVKNNIYFILRHQIFKLVLKSKDRGTLIINLKNMGLCFKEMTKESFG